MKKDLHPKTYKKEVKCTCGATYVVLTTDENFEKVDICSNCHPYFTGKDKTLDATGRVQRFKKRFGMQ